MPTAHIVTTKTFTFRGKAERFSNGYNLQIGANEPTEAYIKSLADALVTMERAFTASNVTFVYRVGGLLGQDAVYAEEVTSPPNGLYAQTASEKYHPEMCALAQSKIGPKRYLMKYYHAAAFAVNALQDAIQASDKTRIDAALVKLTDGSLPGAAAACRPNGALATVPFTCDPFVRVHQLKRRGKRP